MLHVNRGNSAGGGRTINTMCTRRHRGMMQTSIILILFVCIGYGFYLYNILQIQMKDVDIRAGKYRQQHQALSDQLQAVYEERSRLEKSLQNEKDDHANTKQEYLRHKEEVKVMAEQQLQAHQHEKEEINVEKNKLMQEINEQKNNYDNLLLEHDKVREEHDALKQQHQEIKDDLNVQLNKEKENNRLLADSHNQLQVDHDNIQQQLKQAQEKVSELNQMSQFNENNAHIANKKLEEQTLLYNNLQAQLNEALESHRKESDLLTQQIDGLQNDADRYNKLINLLQAVGTDVLNLEHEKMKGLSDEDRKILFAHFTGSSEHAEMLEQRRKQLEQENQARQEALLNQQRQQQERDQQLQQRKDQQQPHNDVDPRMTENPLSNGVQQGDQQLGYNVCNLPVQPGACSENIVRFYFDSETSSCNRFAYTGCDGNQNNFDSQELCEETCIDNVARGTADQGDSQGQNGGNYPRKSQDEMDENNLQHIQLDQNRFTVENENFNGVRTPEEIARLQEEAARRELDEQNKRTKEEMMNTEAAFDAVERLKQLQEQQVEVAREQEDNMNKLLEQAQKPDEETNEIGDEDDENYETPEEENNNGGIIEGEVDEQDEQYTQEEPDNDEEGENRYDDNEGNANNNDEGTNLRPRIDLPPAAQVAGDEPEEVVNMPPVNSLDDNNEEENEDEDEELNNQGETEYGDGNYQEEQYEHQAGSKNNRFPQQLDQDEDQNADYGYRDNVMDDQSEDVYKPQGDIDDDRVFRNNDSAEKNNEMGDKKSEYNDYNYHQPDERNHDPFM